MEINADCVQCNVDTVIRFSGILIHIIYMNVFKYVCHQLSAIEIMFPVSYIHVKINNI